MYSSFLSDLKNSTAVDESLFKNFNKMFCPREYQPTSRLNQQNEKPTSKYPLVYYANVYTMIYTNILASELL